jgi:hypothetical protein
MRSDSKLTKAELRMASEETRYILKKPPLEYANTDAGFGCATRDFEFLMDYALGTDEGEVINNALDWKRWELQAYYKKLHNWDIV